MVVSSRLRLATGRVAGVEHGEAAGAVGGLEHAGREAGLADGGRLLVAGDAEDRHRRGRRGRRARSPKSAARVADLGQHRHRHVEERADVRVPGAARGCRRAACGRRWWRRWRGRAPPVSCQISQVSTVPKSELAASRRRSRAPGVRVEQPLELGAGEVGVEEQAGALGDHRPRGRRRASSAQSAAVRRSCQTMARPSGSPVARSQTSVVSRWLVMPIAAIAAGREAGPLDRGAADGGGRGPDVVGVVLDPARLREVLRELLLRRGDDAPCARRTRWPGSRSCPGRSRGCGPSRVPPGLARRLGRGGAGVTGLAYLTGAGAGAKARPAGRPTTERASEF